MESSTYKTVSVAVESVRKEPIQVSAVHLAGGLHAVNCCCSQCIYDRREMEQLGSPPVCEEQVDPQPICEEQVSPLDLSVKRSVSPQIETSSEEEEEVSSEDDGSEDAEVKPRTMSWSLLNRFIHLSDLEGSVSVNFLDPLLFLLAPFNASEIEWLIRVLPSTRNELRCFNSRTMLSVIILVI